jgi:ABC-type sulfate transport system substrate-binding protein
MVILSYLSVKVAFAIFGVTLFLGQTMVLGEDQITNASYDVSREFYQEVNQAFGKIWKTKTGRDVRIQQSHAATSTQARAATDFVRKLYRNASVLDVGGRAATTTFITRQIGDVLINFESEAALLQETAGKGQIEIVIPSITLPVEFPVAVVDSVVERHHSRPLAEAYLSFLFSEAGQQLARKYHYKSSSADFARDVNAVAQTPQLIDVDKLFGGWRKAQERFFADGGVFDQIYTPGQ